MKLRLLLGLAFTLSGLAGPVAAQTKLPTAPLPAGQPTDELVITNVNVVDPSTGDVEPHANVVMRDGVIIAVGEWVPAGRGVPRIDGKGLYLIPGLWDARTHALATAAQERAALPLYVAHGITSIRDVTTTRPLAELLKTYQALEAGERTGPRFEMAGPVLDASADGHTGLRLNAGRAEGRARATAVVQAGWCSLQTGPLLSPDAYWGIVAAAQEGRVRVAGPAPESLPVLEALAAGQHIFESADKLLLGCSSHEAALVASRAQALAGPKPLGTLQGCTKAQRREVLATFSPARCTALGQSLAQYKAFVMPLLVTHDFALQQDPAPENPHFRSVPAAVRQQWAQATRSRQHAAAAERSLARAADSLQRRMVAEFGRLGVRIVAGSDAGADTPNLFHGSSLLDELEHLVAAGLSPAQALCAATVAPALATGHGYELGRIHPGYLADVVLLGANPLADIRNLRQVRAVVLRGRLFDLPALAGLAAEAEQAGQPSPLGQPTAIR